MWKRQVNYLADRGYGLYVWLGGTPFTEDVRDRILDVNALQR